MSAGSQHEGSTVEFELDVTRIIVLFLILMALLIAAFYAGRASVAPADGGRFSSLGAVSEGFPMTTEDVGDVGLFDRVGEGGSERERGRQVTAESAAGAFELDLGVVRSRQEAESAQNRLQGAGFPAFVAGARGGYRVVAGPFATEDAALRAQREIASKFGVTPKVLRGAP